MVIYGATGLLTNYQNNTGSYIARDSYLVANNGALAIFVGFSVSHSIVHGAVASMHIMWHAAF